MGKLMPILKPSGYRKDVPYFFKEQLFDNAASPVVAFGKDEGISVAYETAASEAAFNERFPVLKQEALANLQSIQPEIQVQELEGSKIAFVMGDEYASEKILDVAFMQRVGQQIGAERLMVGIPFKGVLIASDFYSDLRMKFPAVIVKYYQNPQQDPISDMVFLVDKGEIVGIGGEKVEDDDGPGNFTIAENAKTHNYTVRVNCQSIGELTNTVNTTYQEVMAGIMQKKAFGGEVVYHIGPGLPLNQPLIDKCRSYCEQIESNEMAQMVIHTLTGKKLRLSFYYEDQLIAPAGAVAESKAEASPYSGLTTGELEQEFYRIVSIPNARTNVTALKDMTALMKEYQSRGLELPDANARPAASGKKWWQFWK